MRVAIVMPVGSRLACLFICMPDLCTPRVVSGNDFPSSELACCLLLSCPFDTTAEVFVGSASPTRFLHRWLRSATEDCSQTFSRTLGSKVLPSARRPSPLSLFFGYLLLLIPYVRMLFVRSPVEPQLPECIPGMKKYCKRQPSTTAG